MSWFAEKQRERRDNATADTLRLHGDSMEVLRRSHSETQSVAEEAHTASKKAEDAIREMWAVLNVLMDAGALDAWQLHSTEQVVRESRSMPLSLKKQVIEVIRNLMDERPDTETVRLSKIQVQQKEIAELEEADARLFEKTDAVVAALKPAE